MVDWDIACEGGWWPCVVLRDTRPGTRINYHVKGWGCAYTVIWRDSARGNNPYSRCGQFYITSYRNYGFQRAYTR